jgi:hypothetical protein
MGLRTLFHYLFGNRHAILTPASSPSTVWLGALFALSAGLAGAYDRADLLHEPWRLLVPFATSLLESMVLFALAGCPGDKQTGQASRLLSRPPSAFLDDGAFSVGRGSSL